MADEPDLHPSESDGEWVTYLQGVLSSLGFNTSDQEGTYGDGTEQAVRSFQQGNQCTVDGWVGGETWAKLLDLMGSGGGTADVPDDIVALGFPATTDQFTAEQRDSVFKGREKEDEAENGSPESFQVAAIQAGAGGDEGSWA